MLGEKKKSSAVEELSFSFYTSNGEVNVSKDTKLNNHPK